MRWPVSLVASIKLSVPRSVVSGIRKSFPRHLPKCLIPFPAPVWHGWYSCGTKLYLLVSASNLLP